MSIFQSENQWSYQKPERSQIEWRKTINRCQYKMTEMLELCDKNFKAAVINMFHQVIRSMIETNEVQSLS